jgi:hypothetical protein
MSNITSTIVPDNTVLSMVSNSQTLNSLTTNIGATTLSQLTDIDLQEVTNGSLLIYDTNEFVSKTLTGAISLNADGQVSVNSNAITLGTHTTGSYVATVSGTSDQVIVTGSGSETANVSLSLPQSIALTSSPTFANITISGTIVNSALSSALDSKSPVGHGHNINEVSSLQTALDGKQPVGNYSTGGGTATGINTGDETSNTIKSKLGITALSGVNTGDQDLSGLVPKTTTVNGKALNTNITLSKSDVGLGAVDNTSDVDKPISAATASALSGKSPVGHTHTASSITDFTSAVSALAAVKSVNTKIGDVVLTKGDIGLDNVDNTSDANKPLSTATSTALDLKANIANPIFTGSVTLPRDPTAALEAATKEYVDNLASGIIAKPSVLFATSTNLDATYSNGVNGVGAKLTSNVDGALTAIGVDGITTGAGVLVKSQTAKAQNGRYFVSTLGSPSTRWVLTRCGLCDEADEIPGAYIFVQDGAFKGSGYVLVVADPPTFTVGVDAIDVFQFSGAGTYTAANGVALNDNQFSADNTIARLDGPTFTGVPSAPTAAPDTSSTQIATTAYAKKEADDAQAAAVQRSNHTGTQSVSTITGLGTLATQSGTFSGTSSGTNTGDQDLSALVPKSTTVNGKALSTNITLNKDDVGLANVDNTSDANKPVSTAQQTALDLKANLAGATFSGAIGATNLSGTNTGDQTITLTSDVTGGGTGSFATTIAAGAVSLAKMANVASSTVFYRKTAGSGAPEVQTLAALKTDLGLSGTNTGDAAYNSSVGKHTASATAPIAPTAGDRWFLTTTGQLFEYYADVDSSQWIEITGTLGIPAGPTFTDPVTFASTTRPTSSGTGTPDATSLITRGDGDARFGDIAICNLSGITYNNQNTLQTAREQTLTPGVYYVLMVWQISGTSNTGTRHGYNFTGSGFARFFRSRVSSQSYTQISTLSFDLGLAESNTGARVEGVISVTATGVMRMQVAQNTSHPDNTTLLAASYLFITRCPSGSIS